MLLRTYKVSDTMSKGSYCNKLKLKRCKQSASLTEERSFTKGHVIDESHIKGYINSEESKRNSICFDLNQILRYSYQDLPTHHFLINFFRSSSSGTKKIPPKQCSYHNFLLFSTFIALSLSKTRGISN